MVKKPMSKNEMARYIVMVLFNLHVLPGERNVEVLSLVRNHTRGKIEHLRTMAIRANTPPARGSRQ